MQEHGDFQIFREGTHLLVSRMSGMYNEQGAKAYVRKIKATIEEFQGQDYVMLLDFQGTEGATPEAFHEMSAYIEWQNQLGNMIAKAYILGPKSMLTQQMLKQWAPHSSYDQIGYYSTEDEARQWLEEQFINKTQGLKAPTP